MKSIQEILHLSIDYLAKKGIENPRRQAELLLSDALNIRRMDLYLQFERPLNDGEIQICRNRLQRRGEGEPLEYIHGSIEFLGCSIRVCKEVLIPRPETEILVDQIIQKLKQQKLNKKILWDLCCGSGCIGIAIKKALPELEVTLSDISEKAVTIARENGKNNQVEIDIKQGDLFTPFEGEKAHYIICNPPYISFAEYQELSKEVRDFEPKQALLAGDTGLEYYQKIASTLKNHLYPHAKVWLEIGYNQGPQVQKIFSLAGWNHTKVETDWAGHPRFFSLENE